MTDGTVNELIRLWVEHELPVDIVVAAVEIAKHMHAQCARWAEPVIISDTIVDDDPMEWFVDMAWEGVHVIIDMAGIEVIIIDGWECSAFHNPMMYNREWWSLTDAPVAAAWTLEQTRGVFNPRRAH